MKPWNQNQSGNEGKEPPSSPRDLCTSVYVCALFKPGKTRARRMRLRTSRKVIDTRHVLHTRTNKTKERLTPPTFVSAPREFLARSAIPPPPPSPTRAWSLSRRIFAAWSSKIAQDEKRIAMLTGKRINFIELLPFWFGERPYREYGYAGKESTISRNLRVAFFFFFLFFSFFPFFFWNKSSSLSRNELFHVEWRTRFKILMSFL